MNAAYSTLEQVIHYLTDSADHGAEPAEAEAVYELAPEVYLVHDRYRGYVEYDVYFDPRAVRLDAVATFAAPWGVHQVSGGVCSRSAFLTYVKNTLDATWHPEPVEVYSRVEA